VSRLTIVLDRESAAYRPLETVSGRIQWQLDGESAEKLTLELLWHTEGKGTRDAQQVASMQVDRPRLSGEREFRFTLPLGPCSVSGKLLSIVWKLEADTDPGGDTEHLAIVVSPTGTEIDLTADGSP